MVLLPVPAVAVNLADANAFPVVIAFSRAMEFASNAFVKRMGSGLGFPTEAPPPLVQLDSAVTPSEQLKTGKGFPPSSWSCPESAPLELEAPFAGVVEKAARSVTITNAGVTK